MVAELDGGTYVVASGDHVNGDAVAWRVNADGSVMFAMNNRAPVVQEASLGGRIRPAYGSTRIMLSVAADGAPAIALQDGKDRPRLRLTVTPEGYGAIEFLDAEGKVVEVLAPETRRSR